MQAGNGTLSDADRASLATTIQSSYDQLVGIANSDDGNGQYLFAGFKSGSRPSWPRPAAACSTSATRASG